MIQLPRTIGYTLISCLLLTGCAASPPVINCELHAKTAKDFARQLRWRETDQALQLVAPAPTGPRSAWAEALKPLEITDYTVKELSCTPTTEVATSILDLSYLRSGSATLRRTDITVEWRQQADQGWRVTSPPPALP